MTITVRYACGHSLEWQFSRRMSREAYEDFLSDEEEHICPECAEHPELANELAEFAPEEEEHEPYSSQDWLDAMYLIMRAQDTMPIGLTFAGPWRTLQDAADYCHEHFQGIQS